MKTATKKEMKEMQDGLRKNWKLILDGKNVYLEDNDGVQSPINNMTIRFLCYTIGIPIQVGKSI